MSEKDGVTGFWFFLAGLSVGAIVALLYAPKSGEETRELLRGKAEEGKQFVTARGREFQQQAQDAVEKAKTVVAKQKEQLSAALEAGKQAYHEEKAKVR
jgi:gas vesicle protein